jgi:hypothetical protein
MHVFLVIKMNYIHVHKEMVKGYPTYTKYVFI